MAALPGVTQDGRSLKRVQAVLLKNQVSCQVKAELTSGHTAEGTDHRETERKKQRKKKGIETDPKSSFIIKMQQCPQYQVMHGDSTALCCMS